MREGMVGGVIFWGWLGGIDSGASDETWCAIDSHICGSSRYGDNRDECLQSVIVSPPSTTRSAPVT